MLNKSDLCVFFNSGQRTKEGKISDVDWTRDSWLSQTGSNGVCMSGLWPLTHPKGLSLGLFTKYILILILDPSWSFLKPHNIVKGKFSYF